MAEKEEAMDKDLADEILEEEAENEAENAVRRGAAGTRRGDG